MKSDGFPRYYFAAGVFAGVLAGALFFAVQSARMRRPAAQDAFDTDFGNWLAAQHAIYSDDFEKAAEFLGEMADARSESVAAARSLALFLDRGRVFETDGAVFQKTGRASLWVIGAAREAGNGNWKKVRADFKNEKSQMLAPFRIWSSAATKNIAEAAAFIDGNKQAGEPWKNFQKGAVYAATKNPKTAKRFFEKVPASFMNLGDYHLAMSFYKEHGFIKEAEILAEDWLGSPGGMYMAGADLSEDWTAYDTFQKMLAAALVQNVSHGGEAGLADTGLLILRVAGMLVGVERGDLRNAMADSIYYYTGGYFYANGSDNYKKYWDKVRRSPVYGPFVEMKIAEKAGFSTKTAREFDRILRKSPLFVPVIQKLWKQNMQNGRENDTLRILNRALRQPKIPDAGRAYLLKLRAHTQYIFDDLDGAERDLKAASALAPMDAGIMGLTARVWAAKKTNLDEAYRYAISLVRAFPSSVENWNVLALVVLAKEGPEPALEILERIGRVAEECSELFLNLGDLRSKTGSLIAAKEAYRKAMALSGDGLVVKSEVERKLRRLK